ncbi:MAG TPA: MFS transporter [Candidatus Deferrimicrobium sp.]|nr:MFS transporter [Candidatus Deferrimicrobium sp.]
MRQEKLPLGKKISFSLGNIGGLAVGQSTILLLYTYYLLYLGVPLTPLGISLILVFYGIWDALNEPIIGHISDFTRSRWGRRKPFIMIGLIPLIIFSFLIYTPPTNNALSCIIYLIIILFFYELFVTMVITNWYSLFPELTLEPNERLSVSKFLQIFGLFGLIIGLGVAPMIAGSFPTKLQGYSMMGLILGMIAVISMLPTVLFIKERKEYQVKAADRISFFKGIKISLRNRTFILFVLVQFLLQLSYALVLSSLPLLFEGILGLGELEYSLLLLAAFITVIPGLFLWINIAKKHGTKTSLFLSMICFGAVFPLSFIIFNPIIALIVLLLAGIGLGGLMLLPTILLSDVIDEDQTKTKKRREGLYSGTSGVIVKLANAISWAIIGIMLTIFQIDRENLTPATLTPLNELGLRILIGVLPLVVIAIGLLCLYKYPLDGAKLAEVQKQVQILDEELVKKYEKNLV